MVEVRQREASHTLVWYLLKGFVWRSGCSGCLPVIVMVQAAEDWMGDDLPTRWRPVLSLWLARNALIYPLVWSGKVEVADVFLDSVV